VLIQIETACAEFVNSETEHPPAEDLLGRAYNAFMVRTLRTSLTLLALALICPTPAEAWGFEAHKLIADRFIALLPQELRPLFERRRAFIVERSIDPDLWRNVGWDDEPPNHFMDLDYYGKDPFPGLPHDYDRAVAKFGRDVVHQQGLLPWRTAEFHGRLRRAFESLNRESSYALDDIVLFSALIAHYASDGHVPLHGVMNYDGQLTDQHGLHSRWEAELFERNRTALKIAPAVPVPVTDAREFMFTTLLASSRLAEGVLQADRKAVAGREFYDDRYFEVLGKEQLATLERRLNDSITAVASLVIGAWEEAGKPAVPVERTRKPRPVRRPGAP
jgi:hypothetical protein